ncbi:Pisatin demethylase [Escovopsis weberi]|uniref:Pisatin demethylase n=1 Tax=Escovopsis weberi TaxID=150374 RepID=A0A0M8N1H3_ESCWE|nr:Pisatin demethylase [Escovopsis weberi]
MGGRAAAAAAAAWQTLAELTWAAGWLVTASLAVSLPILLGAAAYRLFLHPLASIPGPRLAALSNAWHARHVRRGRAAELGRRLHKQYGPVVRVGPDEVWCSSKEAFDLIYNTTRGFEKTDFYYWRLHAHFHDSLDLLSERDAKRYRLQRRLIGRVYQTANVLRHEQALDHVLDKVIERIQGLGGAEIDLKEWMHIVAVECLSACVLSWSPGLLRDGTDWSASSHSYFGWRRKSVLGLFPTMAKLGLCSPWFDRLFRDLWGLTFTSPENFKSFFPDVGKQVNRRINVALKSTATKPKPKPKPNAWKKNKKKKIKAGGNGPDEAEHEARGDLLDDLIQLHRDKPDFTENYLRKMAITNFGAGHDTMASTLTSVLAMIGRHADVQRRVAAEVRGLNDAASSENAANVPYTRAAIREAMRLHPVISMSLPRAAPDGGVLLHGHWIPGGTTMGCNPVALHRDQGIVGPDPDAYDPDRWLDAGAQGHRTMERYSLNWGGGARTCPGRNLAEMIVYKAVPALLSRFDVEVSVPREDEMPSYFLSMMTGVKARFLPLGETQL